MAAKKHVRTNPGGGEITLVEQFLSLTRQVEMLGKQLNVNIQQGHPSRAPLFEQLSVIEQKLIIQRLSNLIAIYSQSLTETGGELNSRHLVWSAFKHFGIYPPGDFFDKISDDNIIEVYDLNHFQVFANLAFYDCCSYTLEEVSCLKWTQLWERETPEHTGLLMSYVDKFCSAEEHQTFKVDFPECYCHETRSPFRYRLRYDLKFGAAVRRRGTGQTCGYVAIESAEIVSKRLTALEEEMLLLQHHARLVAVGDDTNDSSV